MGQNQETNSCPAITRIGVITVVFMDVPGYILVICMARQKAGSLGKLCYADGSLMSITGCSWNY